MLKKLESVLTQKDVHREVVHEVVEFYGTELNEDRLKTQLTTLHCMDTDGSTNDIQSVITQLKGLNDVERAFCSEVIKVTKLILVMPATNALSERSFSALRRVKTWLRSTIDQVRLNNCMTLNVHKTKTDTLPLLTIGNEFIQRNSSRMHIFGQFSV